MTTLRTTGIVVRTDREGDRVRLTPAGPFDLAHATTAAREIANAEREINRCRAVELDLSELGRIDGTGAVLLARLLDRLVAGGRTVHVVEERNREASNLITIYRERRSSDPQAERRPMTPLARLGLVAAGIPSVLNSAHDFIGHTAAALPKAARTPSSVDWRSLPRLVQAVAPDPGECRRIGVLPPPATRRHPCPHPRTGARRTAFARDIAGSTAVIVSDHVSPAP